MLHSRAELSSGDLERWDGVAVGGRYKKEGIQVYIQQIYFTVQQKLTQHCKEMI